MPVRSRSVVYSGLLAGAVAAAGLVMPMAASGNVGAGDDYTSIFADGNLKGAGWASCPTAIVWDADVAELSPRGATNAISDLDWALTTWGKAAGLPVTRGMALPLKYDDASATVSSGAAPGGRKIYVKFVQDKDSNYMSGRVVGVATPTSVIPTNAEVITGSAAFRVDYLEYANKSESRTLLLHELGHALGLGHSNDKQSVMFPIVTSTTKLSAGDIAGIRAFTKSCDPAVAVQRGQ